MEDNDTHPLGTRPKGTQELTYEEKSVSLKQMSDELSAITSEPEETICKQRSASH